MTIVFIHPHRAFLPELEAYANFFSAYGINIEIAYPSQARKINADLEWRFMGVDLSRRHEDRIIIHEYASASLPILRKIKDRIKTILNIKPDYRIFLNEYVRQQFRFTDGIPYGLRDMGLAPSLVDKNRIAPIEKKYDFIYCGSVGKDRRMEKLFSAFNRAPLNKQSLFILSREYSGYAKKYSSATNITFCGPVHPAEVPGYILHSRYAINYRPQVEPHAQQTPAKLLEYAACQIPILTSDFPWVREFCKKFGGRFFFLENDLSNLTWENVTQFNYSFPDLKDWTWENQIRKSGILGVLELHFSSLHF